MMKDSPYWNPRYETLPRADLERLQLYKLQRLARWAWERSPFMRRRFEQAGFHPDQLRTLDDRRRIPFLTKQEWMDEQAQRPLFGDLLANAPDNAIAYHTTSGTSGRTPLRVLDSLRDWNWISEMWAYGFWGFGVRPTDIVYLAFGYGTFIGFWGAHYCCQKIGALTIASGGMTSEARVKQLVELGATTVCLTPTYALRLLQVARELGIDLARESRVDKLVLSGEPGANIPAVRRLIEEGWGARCSDMAGMTEIGTIMIFQCRDSGDSTHIIEDHFLEEVINPQTGEPVGYGEVGERVVTSFGRAFIPLLRYRSGDLVVRVPHTACRCGRTFDLYKGGIIGRADDMKIIRGTNVFPSAVEAIVREHPEVDEFQIVLTREEDIRDEITVVCELRPDCEHLWPQVQLRLAKALAAGHENLRFNVERAERGQLPRFELKARRLVDKREYGR